MPAPSSILLLHGLGGSGTGSVNILEQRLRAGGWNDAVYLRPTLQGVNSPAKEKSTDRVFVQAWDEMNAFLGTRVPHLTVGLSFGGLLAAFSPSPLRLSICSPWDQMLGDTIQKASVRPGWRVLQGERDEVVPAGPSLEVLPDFVPRTVDPLGDHDFDQWMDRIALWVHSSWETFQVS